VEDYGKVAVTFVETKPGRAVRIAPASDIRQKAHEFVSTEPRHYFAQMQAYQIMPDEVMFTVQEVVLNAPIGHIVSRPGMRVRCDLCGEEIMNEREIIHEGSILCRSCAGDGYYQSAIRSLFKVSGLSLNEGKNHYV
jgi:formylmethanofuran dehydrogenase subunit E